MTVIEGVIGTREGHEQYCAHLADLAPPFLQLQSAEPLCSICFIAHSESAAGRDPEQIQPSKKQKSPTYNMRPICIGKPLGTISLEFGW